MAEEPDNEASGSEAVVPVNDLLVMISGESASGKSASLRNIKNQERWMYLNCEAGKKLPFKNKFHQIIVTDPYQVISAMEYVQGNPEYDGIIVDTLTFLLDMYESKYIYGAADGRQAWGNFQQYFKELMQDKVAQSDKSVIFLAHTRSEYDEKALETKTSIPVKGALKNNGIEAYFSTVVSTKKVSLKDLEPYKSDLLNITEDDEILGFKYVFQTRLTKKTTGERIRSPMGMFSKEQTYIDNDAGMLLEYLKQYYA